MEFIGFQLPTERMVSSDESKMIPESKRNRTAAEAGETKSEPMQIERAENDIGTWLTSAEAKRSITSTRRRATARKQSLILGHYNECPPFLSRIITYVE